MISRDVQRGIVGQFLGALYSPRSLATFTGHIHGHPLLAPATGTRYWHRRKGTQDRCANASAMQLAPDIPERAIRRPYSNQRDAGRHLPQGDGVRPC
jgi:hypothetical protein